MVAYFRTNRFLGPVVVILLSLCGAVVNAFTPNFADDDSADEQLDATSMKAHSVRLDPPARPSMPLPMLYRAAKPRRPFAEEVFIRPNWSTSQS